MEAAGRPMKSSSTIIDTYYDVTKADVILLGRMLDEGLKNDIYLACAKRCVKREETGIVAFHDFIGICTGEDLFLLPLKMMPLLINSYPANGEIIRIKLTDTSYYTSSPRAPIIARWRLKVGM